MPEFHNFFPGPSSLPRSVLEKLQRAILDYNGSGLSVLEISHRNNRIKDLFVNTKALLKQVAGVPDDYEVLFLHGGASTQFAMIPLNLKKLGVGNYIVSGQWSQKAYEEAMKVAEVSICASSFDKGYWSVPKAFEFSGDPGFIHVTSNNTIYGTRFESLPQIQRQVPLICDASSDFLSRKFDVEQLGLVYACAQKNMGTSGVTVVILDPKILPENIEEVPEIFNYKKHISKESLLNTPPVFAVFAVYCVLEWIQESGGVLELEKINQIKSDLLYSFLDEDESFEALVQDAESRSHVNICFKCKSQEEDQRFLDFASSKGFIGLSGHRKVGHMRASLYNSVSLDSVQRLVELMKSFSLNLS